MPNSTAPETDSDRSYAGHAGRMLWPRNTNDLTDTTLCPACHAPLPSAVCPACGLDLRHPAAVRLLAASTDAAAALDRRANLIGRIRFDTAHAPAPTPAPAAAAPAAPAARHARPAPEHIPGPVAEPAPVREPEPSSGPQPAAHPTRRKRSSVQILLLLVGVSLVSVAAIFFLTVAWLFAGIEMRSAIVGLFTAAALVTAAVLSRKGLAATAEGIGALAVVLVLLDAWALRENDLFGLHATDETLYWGVALLCCAALFFGAHALSRLRVASVAGFAVAAPGLGLLVAGLAYGQTGSSQAFLVFLGTAVGTLIHRFTLPRDSALWPSIDRVPERMILLSLGALSLVAAFVTAFLVDPATDQAPLWTLGAVAVVAALHVAQVVTTDHAGTAARLFAYGGASLAALAATLTAPTVAVRADDLALSLTAPIISAVTLALSLEVALRRLGTGPSRTAAAVAAVTAAAMAAGSAFFVVGWASVPLADAVVGGLTRAGDPVASIEPESAWALGSLVAVGGLTALVWALGGILRARRHLVAWLALIVIVFAVPFAGSLWLVLFAYLLLGALALGARLLAGHGRLRLGPYRPVVIALLVAAETSGYLVSWADSDSWWIGTISAVLVLFFARLLPDRTSGAAARGALLAGAIVLALVGAGAAPWALTLGAEPSGTALLVNVVRGLTLATAAFQVVIALAWRGVITETERRWAFWTLLAPTVLAFTVPLSTYVDSLSPAERATLQPEPAAGIAHAALLLAAPLLWVLARGNQGALPRERFVAAVALAPAFLLLAWNIIRATDAPASVESIAVPAVALVVCAIALALGTLRARGRERLGLEIGAAIILVPTVGEAAGLDRPLGWLTLVLAGVAALLVAIAPDGLFASLSPRRHLGWLALALGTAGLWLGLSRAGEDALEPYVLPLAGVLLVVAALTHRFGRVDRTVTASPVAALLTLAGLSVAIAPLALAGQTGSLLRPIVVGTVSAVLLLGATAIRRTPPWPAYLAAVGVAGAAGVFLTASGRVGRALDAPGGPDGRLEAWLLPAALVFVVAGTQTVVAARRGSAGTALPSVDVRTRFGYGLVIAALLGILFAELLALDFAPLAFSRVILLAWLFSALHLAAFWVDPSPLGRLVSWVAIGSGGAIVLAGYSYSAPDPIEIVSVPLAVALLTSGWLHLDATASARSWPWLAPGVLVLLVPSLLLDATESPLWRVVGLGILAIVVVVGGAARRLQAPFVIGAVVLLIHALAQLWPWISLAYGSAPWWLWLGIGGVLLIVLAARYEQRIKNLRSVALMISALR